VYEAVHEVGDHWFVFTMCITLIALFYMSAIYVYHYTFVCSRQLRFDSGAIKRNIYFIFIYLCRLEAHGISHMIERQVRKSCNCTTAGLYH
jgi:hypothetical protein